MIAPHLAAHPSVDFSAGTLFSGAHRGTSGASSAGSAVGRVGPRSLRYQNGSPNGRFLRASRSALLGLAGLATCRSCWKGRAARARKAPQRRAVLPRLEGLPSLDTPVHRRHPGPGVPGVPVPHHGGHGHAAPAGDEPELGAVVRQLYASFNQCDPHRTAACFTEDVVYEDLLLGNSTIVQSRAEFLELIRTHPVFVSARACGMLGLPPLDIKVEVDNISEDVKRSTVGVEWHVEVGGQPLVLGRGLSFMKIDPETGLIAKATDIAEAPWRAIGLVLSPFARGIRDVSRLLRDWSFSSVITVVLFAILFLDQSSLDQLRDDIDTLDDFRKGLDQSDHNGLKAILAQMVAKNQGA